MSVESDITTWIRRLKEDDSNAAQAIWNQYSTALLRMVRHKLGGMPRRANDEEDVALSAMNSFFHGVAAGRFPKLDDRDDLWKILVTIAARKASAQRRKHFRLKRGAGEVRGESVFFVKQANDQELPVGLEQIQARSSLMMSP